MRTQLVLSAIIAALAAVFGASTAEKNGDPSAVIQDVERRLAETFRVRSVVERVIQSAPAGLSRDEFEALLTKELQTSGLDPKELLNGKTPQSPAWGTVKPIFDQLTWQNQQIATAKAMLHYDSSPDGVESYVWERRSKVAAEPWHFEEPSQFRRRRIGFATAGGAAGFVGGLGFLVLLAWLWKFFLARLREVSDAIRAK